MCREEVNPPAEFDSGLSDISIVTSEWVSAARLHLTGPSSTLVEYSDLIKENCPASMDDQVKADLDRIHQSARSLFDLVGNMFSEQNNTDLASLEHVRRLRHDLRSPINAVLGYSELLIDDEADSGDRNRLCDDLQRLADQSRELLQSIDEIFDALGEPNDNFEEAVEKIVDGGDVMDLRVSMNDADVLNRNRLTGDILVVDDIANNRDLLERRLVRDGHTVFQAADGLSALRLLGEKAFDLVLLDLIMPEMNGFDVLQRMKADEIMRNIPVIINSSLEDGAGAVRCIEAGAFDYLPKPFNPQMLRARIQAGLESKIWTDSERSQREYIQRAFERFLSPAVVKTLMDNPDNFSLGGERAEISCVFTDLAGFTTLIETCEPTEVLPQLNRYLDGLCRIVLAHEGTIDKIVGDALHAFFGAPLKQSDHAHRAVLCAIELDRYARQFAAEEKSINLGFGNTRIGVHTGVAVVGNFGGESFFDYTAHGDVVNTTARMEVANKHLGTTVCISDTTRQCCPAIEFRPVGQLLLRGKSAAVSAYEPIDNTLYGRCPLQSYVQAYERVRNGSADAERHIELLLNQYPDDALLQLYRNRIRSGTAGVVIDATVSRSQVQ